eukprot:473056_1
MSSPQRKSFQSNAIIFIYQNKTWMDRDSGLVRFILDELIFEIHLIIQPDTTDEFEYKLTPRIRSKGPLQYIVRAKAENGTKGDILAVRFEREAESKLFRDFVDQIGGVDDNQKNTQNNNNNNN